MPSVAEVLAAAALPGDEAERDAEVLLCRALGKARTYLLAWPEAAVPGPALEQFEAWARPDTELLVEQALQQRLPGDARVLDLGTGSGAIALALAAERPHWQVTGTDVSEAALAVARSNGERLGLGRVRWRRGSWFEPLEGERFHLVVSNPPYIADDDPHLQSGDLLREPRSALVAADLGLRDLEYLVGSAPRHLVAGGVLLLEHGFAQGEAVRSLLTTQGYSEVRSWRDLGGHERISGGVWKRGDMP